MKNFNATQVEMINETVNTGIQSILDTFPEFPQISKQILQALIVLNLHSQLDGLMSENKHPEFQIAGHELKDIIFSRDYKRALVSMQPLFYLCGRQIIDHKIMFPLERLQTPPWLSEEQHIELKIYIEKKLQTAINDLKPHAQKRTRKEEQPGINKHRRSVPEPKTKATYSIKL